MRFSLHDLAVAAVLAALGAAPPLAAQGVGWNGQADASVSLFFGNTEQRVATMHSALGHADSAFELQGDARFTYGEASVQTDSVVHRSVNQRSWAASISFDRHPFARVSPFFSGAVESSLEKQIDLRYNAGLGVKVTFVNNDAIKTSFSLAMLGEHTNPRGPTPPDLERTVARWSARYQLNYKIDDQLTLSDETYYQPRFSRSSEYTFTTNTSLAYQLMRSLSLTLTMLDNYDSQAKLRGARSNNDGQFLFGVLTKF